jgi:hypothetical protein
MYPNISILVAAEFRISEFSDNSNMRLMNCLCHYNGLSIISLHWFISCIESYRLYELFLSHLQAPAPEGWGIVLDNSDENEIEEMFFEHL